MRYWKHATAFALAGGLFMACSDGTTTPTEMEDAQLTVEEPSTLHWEVGDDMPAAESYRATLEWHVTPVELDFPGGGSIYCPEGTYLAKDLKVGDFPYTATFDGKSVTLDLTYNDDNSFNFFMDGGVVSLFYVKAKDYLKYQYDPVLTDGIATNSGPVSYDYGLHTTQVGGDGNFQTDYFSHVDLCLIPIDPQAKISIAIQNGINEVGTEHVLTGSVEVDLENDGIYEAAPEGTEIDFVTDFGTFKEADAATPTEASCLTILETGQCSVTLLSDAVGKATVTASTSVTYYGIILNRSTDGDADLGNSDPAEKYWVDAWITIEADGLNGVTEEHEFTAKLYGSVGTLPEASIAFDELLITIDAPLGGLHILDTNYTADLTDCVTPPKVDNSGAEPFAYCAAKLNSQLATLVDGSDPFVANADGKVTVSGVIRGEAVSAPQISRTTDGLLTTSGLQNSSFATKDYRVGALSFLKIDASTGLPLGGATFTVCRTMGWSSVTSTFVDIPDECDNLLDDGSGTYFRDTDNVNTGRFDIERLNYAGLALGYYTVVEYAAPAGYTFVANQQPAALALLNPSQTNFYTFENTPEILEGCTPGFWRNHLDAWEGYDPDDGFFRVFVVMSTQGLDFAMTLETAINLGGGDFKKLARHATAALLNASSSQTDYAMSEADIISAVVNAFNTGVSEPLATELDEYNNAGCDVE